MFLTNVLRRVLGRSTAPRQPHTHRKPARAARPRLECLEDRTAPAILFHQGVSVTVSDHDAGQARGPVLTSPQVELVFWGAAWNTGSNPTLRTNVVTAADTILRSPFADKLGQYGVGTGTIAGSLTITSSSPGATFTNANVKTMLQNNIGGSIPYHSNWLYMVIVQPGSTDPAEGLGGEHSVGSASGSGNFYYGWTRNVGGANPMDDIRPSPTRLARPGRSIPAAV
jgi:hypothetical protein